MFDYGSYIFSNVFVMLYFKGYKFPNIGYFPGIAKMMAEEVKMCMATIPHQVIVLQATTLGIM